MDCRTAASSTSATLSVAAACTFFFLTCAPTSSLNCTYHRTRAALDTPALFSTLVMVDAMIRQVQDCAPLPSPGIQSYVSGAIARRASWPSREAALEAFAATPFFAVWDKDALRMYVECGLYEAEGGEVRLKMDGVFEGVCFAEESTPGETFQMLPDLDERVETRWLVAGKLDERYVLREERFERF